MDEIKKLDTAEYGTMKLTFMPFSEIDRIAKERDYTIRYLGTYEIDGKKQLVFTVQNKTVYTEV